MINKFQTTLYFPMANWLKLAFNTIFIEKRMPWKLQRILTYIKINGIRSIITSTRFYLKKPGHRILVSSTFFGGVGGTEKNLLSLVESMEDSIFYIFSENINTKGFVPRSNNYYLNPLFISNKNFDVYYFYAGGGSTKYCGEKYSFKTKIINTNAENIKKIEEKFDHIIHQCTNTSRFFNQTEKHISAFPSVPATFPKNRTKTDLPDKYFLTVFNPFSQEAKGYDRFIMAADHARYPIVWCFSNKTKIKFDSLPEHPNIIRKPNLTQEELFYAYDHAQAFVSFSNYESFGWALAEAFFSNCPIISRKTGFIDYVCNQKGIHTYANDLELFELLSTSSLTAPDYSYDIFTENSYKNVIDRLANTCAPK